MFNYNECSHFTIGNLLFSCEIPLIHGNKIKSQEKLIHNVAISCSIFKNIVSNQNDEIDFFEIDQNKLIIKYHSKTTCTEKTIEEHLDLKTKKIAKRILQHQGRRNLKFNLDKVASAILTSSRETNGSNQAVTTQGSISTLYLYSSGGGGHKSAKEAIVENNLKTLLEKVKLRCAHQGLQTDPRLNDFKIFTKCCREMGLIPEADVLHDYIGIVGHWASSKWNKAQQKGDIRKQEQLASKQWLSDIFFAPSVFFATLNSLKQHHPKSVVSTQAMATPAILSAIAFYNKYYKHAEDEKIKLLLYMTDMPTKYSTHFFSSLKVLQNDTGKKYLILHAPKLEKDQNWQTLCNLPEEQVVELDVKNLPVRPAFVEAVNKYVPHSENPLVKFNVGGKEELNLLKGVLQIQGGSNQINQETPSLLSYPMQPADKRCFIMLGSQPTPSAIEKYIDQFIEIAAKNPNTPYHIFIFAGKFESKDPCFYKDLCESLKQRANNCQWPKNLHIIPLSYQDADQIVCLELQCDTITRSGGSTAMELLILDEVFKDEGPDLKRLKPRRFVHAQEDNEDNVGYDELIHFIPLWEKGNFFFLEKGIGAKVISPQYLQKLFT